MGFFSNIYAIAKKKQEEIKERKEFLNMVEEQAKPIRRRAYMAQMLKEVVEEGKAKAKQDAEARKPQPKKKPEDYGFSSGLQDPFKYINKSK